MHRRMLVNHALLVISSQCPTDPMGKLTNVPLIRVGNFGKPFMTVIIQSRELTQLVDGLGALAR